ncbi:hypothetical protein HYDPIDRAFT_94240 [Hydnomerulius pinastri MD-312]|uniref:Cytochrome c oxidase assembly protein COX20, mitochondrial n=1 Tax=Hydnomerulius pinastri MD-312 TaxID=994086 RepID=A0A0C9WD01_9AGAM|nr:hypothetical protein HYDPIDRAFT_94240 [Hydnomerulius pinastri MD-312]
MTSENTPQNQADTSSPAAGSPLLKPKRNDELSGDFWQDVRSAFQRLGEIPCARNSLLSGIVAGTGFGVIRGMTAGFRVASNWAVGSFIIISLSTWYVQMK